MLSNSHENFSISDDPIVKQEQLDDINASSFTPRAFKSSKNSNHPDENPLLSAVKLDNELNKLCNSNLGDRLTITNDNGDEKRKNETVFHDSVSIPMLPFYYKTREINYSFLSDCLRR